MFVGAVVLLGAVSIPIWIAVKRDHPQKGAIIALTVIGGWTAIGWIIALIWSLSTPRPPTVINQTFLPPPVPLPPPVQKEGIEQQLRSLASLKADGLITEEEFQQKRRSVLMANMSEDGKACVRRPVRTILDRFWTTSTWSREQLQGKTVQFVLTGPKYGVSGTVSGTGTFKVWERPGGELLIQIAFVVTRKIKRLGLTFARKKFPARAVLLPTHASQIRKHLDPAIADFQCFS